MSLKSTHLEESLSSTDDDIKILMPHILNLSLRHDSNEKQIISAINKFLSTTRTRSRGLEYLNLIINNCSSEGVSANALTWISHCLVKHSDDVLKEQKLSIARKVIRNAYQYQEFSKKFLSDYMAKIIEVCLSKHANPHEIESAVETLTVCMITYPSWFSSHKVKIASFLEKFLDIDCPKLVQKAAIAFHYSQQIGNAGVNNINQETNFAAAFTKLCATAHSVFDALFENETELESYNNLGDTFTFAALPHASEKMLHIHRRRVINCLKFLKAMLLTRYPAPKNIRPKQILDVIGRGLALHLCVTSGEERSFQDFLFSLLLITIQIQLLQLLKAFIIWSQTNLLPFSYVVTKILIDSLNRCQKCECFTTNCVYYETVYQVLGYWIHIVKTLPLCHQEQLVSCILNDITPVKEKVTLHITADAAKSKKSKRKETAVISSPTSTSTALSTDKKEFDENKCIFALKTLSDLLFSTPLGLNAEMLKKLYSVIIGTILDIHTSKQIHPYTNEKCQEKLYDVLVAFYEQDTLSVFPPLHMAIQVLNMGANNPNRYISFTCEKGLSMLEKLCQPVCPSTEGVFQLPEPPKEVVLDVVADEVGNEMGEDVLLAAVDKDEEIVDKGDEVPESDLTRPSEVWSETTEILDNSFESESVQSKIERPKTPEPAQEESPSKIVILKDEIIGFVSRSVPDLEPQVVDNETEQTETREEGPPQKKVKLEEELLDTKHLKKESKSFEEEKADIFVGFVDVVKDY